MSKKVVSKVLYSEKDINSRIKQLGQEITNFYKDSKKDLICISILKGSSIFCSDLIREIKLPFVEVDYLAISSYDNNKQNKEDVQEQKSENVKVIMDTRIDIENKNVLIIDDIIDSGLTMKYLYELIKSKNPLSIKICSLLVKNIKEKKPLEIDYYGFSLNRDSFVVGYGLDYQEKYRNLPFIGVLENDT